MLRTWFCRRWGVIGLLTTVVLASCQGGGSGTDPGVPYAGTKLDGAASDFQLVDHNSVWVSLSGFRGKVVVLTFMDSRCDETCPLTALELRAASRALGAKAGQVIFVAVNVNAIANTVEDVATFTREHRLAEIPNWHFLTGPGEQLEPVWRSYAIEVRAKPGEEDFEHTPGVYVIDQGGRLRWYVSTPLARESLTALWPGPPLRELLVRHVEELLREKR